MLEFLGGHIHLGIHVHSTSKVLLSISHNTSDGAWHSVEVMFAQNMTLILLDDACMNPCVTTAPSPFESQQRSVCAYETPFWVVYL